MKVLILALLALIECCILNALSKSSPYDKMVNIFSGKGELLQVNYAKNAGLRGSSVLCAKSSQGDVVLCIPSPREVQNLIDRRCVDKVSKVSEGMWFAFSGLAGDGRALLKEARSFCVNYQSSFGVYPSVNSVARFVGGLQHEATLSSGRRPYGVQVLLIGGSENDDQVSIYLSEPSGEITNWKAVSIGQLSDKYNKQLENSWNEDMSTGDVAQMLLKLAGINENEDVEKSEPVVNENASNNRLSDITSGWNKNMHHETLSASAADIYRFHFDSQKQRRVMTYFSSLLKLKSSM